MKRILIVTSNANKVKEFKEMLEPLGYEVVSLRDLHDDEDVPEYGTTFAENAVIKAEHGMKKYGVPAVADDSGLCIDAFDGGPGVQSARFLGHDTPYSYKNQVILERLKGVTNRGAQFHCAIAFAVPGAQTKVFEGILHGKIADEAKGNGGFGYDPIFWYPQYGKTGGELVPSEKNAVSHRGKAVRRFLEYFTEYSKTEKE